MGLEKRASANLECFVESEKATRYVNAANTFGAHAQAIASIRTYRQLEYATGTIYRGTQKDVRLSLLTGLVRDDRMVRSF